MKTGMGSSATSAGVAEVERIVGSLHRRHIDVHPLNGLAGGIVDRVGMPHTAGRPGRSLYLRRTSVNRKLRLAVENDEHLFALVMEVMADAAFRLDDPPVQEEEIGVEIVVIEQGQVVQLAGSFMDRFG